MNDGTIPPSHDSEFVSRWLGMADTPIRCPKCNKVAFALFFFKNVFSKDKGYLCAACAPAQSKRDPMELEQ